MAKMELSTKKKIGIGASVAVAIAGIGGILYGIFGGRKRNTMSEDDYEFEDGDAAVDAEYTEESTES